jgi:hypothetical protein
MVIIGIYVKISKNGDFYDVKSFQMQIFHFSSRKKRAVNGNE